MAAIITVVLVTLWLSSSSSGEQLQCITPNLSNVKVVLKTKQNTDGNWISTVRLNEEAADHWQLDIKQTAEQCPCNSGNPVLETEFALSALPSIPGTPSQNSSAHRVPISICPTCSPSPISISCHSGPLFPNCPTCPSCPPSTTCPTCSDPTPTSVPTGYKRFVGVGYYKVSTQAETGLDAKRICEQDGGHLAIINSQTEADAIKSLLRKFPRTPGSFNDDEIFIGDETQSVGTSSITVFGDRIAITGYGRWGANDYSGEGESCLSFNRYDNLFNNDVPCSWKLGFICELLDRV